ncbi:flagellar basal body-associated protein FliL [Bermanella marisrubri]|uniref:Flagellar protein FliL n=1 Tax=Bermanella marisrubri TaxID=207949 RepID=Q1MYZ7_9GAMM|nr:flagellar basal body-associated FliL family protein [Bermanella marisrubri]EAT11231.1 flagellar protein [Oceanobacter sp. RED65] [Bermanella marisrubri]QIZ85635.1 flagellar basal body-associated protein FliL [Bermanella marisrubri]
MRSLTVLLVSVLICMQTWSEEGTGGGGTQYVHLQPAFVLNYGENSSGKLKYIRTDVALRVTGAEAAGKVNHHQAYIRNQLVLLLSQQTDETVNTATGREELRQVALEEVKALLSELEGKPYVDDLYFQNFVAQN